MDKIDLDKYIDCKIALSHYKEDYELLINFVKKILKYRNMRRDDQIKIEDDILDNLDYIEVRFELCSKDED